MNQLGVYFLALLFIVAAFMKPLEKFIARGLELSSDPKKSGMVYLGILLVLFTVFFYLSTSDYLSVPKDEVKENFFFTVSKCNPKCSGAYFGKPATFQFTEIKQEGVPCDDDKCPSYGMIRGCQTARVYGGGYAPYTYQCAEGVC